MKKRRSVAGMLGIMLLFSNLLMAEADREMLVKRWKVVKHLKLGKVVPITEDDFLQFTSDGVYEHVRNHYYAKGSWALNADEITINTANSTNWKIVSVSETSMSIANGKEEVMEMEVIKMPAPTVQTVSAKVKYLCMGKWRPNEHHKGDAALKFLPSDIMTFFSDGNYEQILNGVYSKGQWQCNKDDTELTIDATVWKVESLSALFFKLSKVSDPKEFIVFAKTR